LASGAYQVVAYAQYAAQPQISCRWEIFAKSKIFLPVISASRSNGIPDDVKGKTMNKSQSSNLGYFAAASLGALLGWHAGAPRQSRHS